MNEKKAERSELEVKSKYSETEEFILLHLYDHPGQDASTITLTRQYKSVDFGSEEWKKAFADTQYGVETLIADQLISGERKMASDKAVYFDKLKLTKKGEAEAIMHKRRIKKIVLDV